MKKLLLSATLLVASFTSVNAQVFSENWTTPNAGWVSTQIAPDADTNFWGVASVASGTLASQGNFAISESWIGDPAPNGTALTPNNFLISPVINTTALTGALSLSFKVGSPETTASGFYEEYISVYVTDGFNGLAAAMASPVHSAVLAGGDQMYTFTYDISSMLGVDSLMLVFRHHNCTDENFIALDDINVTNGTASVNENVISSMIFPNPTNSVLNVEVAEEVASFEIMSLDGKTVARSTSKNIDVAELKTGMYIYRVATVSGNIGTGNFVKN